MGTAFRTADRRRRKLSPWGAGAPDPTSYRGRVRPKTDPTANPQNAARAAYAVYNAGPRAVGRFEKPKAHPREARVDAKLWTLYRGLAAGGRADLKSCGVGAAD